MRPPRIELSAAPEATPAIQAIGVRNLHLAVDACTGEIVANALTDNGADDASEVPGLLEQVDGKIASFIADGAYDGAPVYQAAAFQQHDPPADVVIPPRASAVTCMNAINRQNQRDRHIRLIAEKGPHGLAEGDWLRPTQPRGNDNRSIRTNDRIEAAGSWHGCSAS